MMMDFPCMSYCILHVYHTNPHAMETLCERIPLPINDAVFGMFTELGRLTDEAKSLYRNGFSTITTADTYFSPWRFKGLIDDEYLLASIDAHNYVNVQRQYAMDLLKALTWLERKDEREIFLFKLVELSVSDSYNFVPDIRTIQNLCLSFDIPIIDFVDMFYTNFSSPMDISTLIMRYETLFSVKISDDERIHLMIKHS